ncbi:poly(u)-specific endoribonuclease-like [Plakobranchus ocellatus]|uniref:Uridylate-specific endoribonuclease n=1 Tax=Plakobranchus ocellatus TaxID=259542 RepID=A0AAV4ABX3_9GAST|nr:poly(u)-specific endoribonuclease-like [Plakobranchus ocellatus]
MSLDFAINGKVRDLADLKATLRRLWFELYPRSGKSLVLDTSGFEHVMVGEFKSAGSVNGMHSWLSFYEKEQNGTLNYYGHTCSVHSNTVCAAFEWDGRIKRKASLFLRTSPAYDIAIYSLCFILYPGGMCPIVVDGTAMVIRTYSKDGHIATAFVVE